MLSGDALMKDIFVRGEDYHMRTAQMVSPQAWGIPPAQVTEAHRSAAKAINFGILYGMSDEGLAETIGCDTDQAVRIKGAIFGKFTKLAAWIKAQLEYARRNGCTWTWWDGEKARRRQLWQIADQDGERRSRAEHGSWNSSIQGTAADYCTASLASVAQWILDECIPAKLILAVHDSLILEVEHDCLDEVAKKVRSIMIGWPTLHHVPLDVDMKIGPSWGSLLKYEKR
jgi:DNA polymerase-1